MTEKSKVEMTFWDHLTELIKRLRRILYFLIISTIVAMIFPVTLNFSGISPENPFYPTITTLVIQNFEQRFLPEGASLLPMSPFAVLEVYMFVSLILGLVISSPFVSYELYKFLNPALHKPEKKMIFQFVASFAGLFLLGFVLGYFLVVPTTVRTLFGFSSMLNLIPYYDFTEFYSMIGLSLLVCSMLFTFPIYIVLLVKAGILRTGQLTKYRKFLYGGVLILISIVDPDPTIITESILFLPIVILTEASILMGKRIEKARAKENSSS